MMDIVKSKIKIGASAPFRILHASDTHLYLVDEHDDAEKKRWASVRESTFPTAEDTFEQIVAHCKTTGYPLFYSGDLIDYVTHPNYLALKRLHDETDCLMSMGNHEYCQYLCESREDDAYKAETADDLKSIFKHDIRFATKVINGVNFVAFDNGYFYVDPDFLDLLKAEVKKGMPIVLVCHLPFYEEKLYWEGGHGLFGAPNELNRQNLDDYHYYKHYTNKITQEFIDYVLSQNSIKLILAGHIHADFETLAFGKIPQLVTGCTSLREIEIE